MKTRLLAAIAAFLLLVPWAGMLDFDFGRFEVDGIRVSAAVVMALTVFFSLVSWSALSWASKGIRPAGALLSVITGESLAVPFIEMLGPMAAVVVGVVAGFPAFMLQKKMIDPARNRPVVAAAATLAAAYLALIILLLAVQGLHSDTVTWIGTAEGIEKSGFDNVFNNSIGFAYFLVTVPSLVATVLVLRAGNVRIRKFR